MEAIVKKDGKAIAKLKNVRITGINTLMALDEATKKANEREVKRLIGAVAEIVSRRQK